MAGKFQFLKVVPLILLLLNFCTNLLYCQTIKVTGNISTSGKFVKYAKIIFTNQDDSLQSFITFTDSSGNYELVIIVTSVNEPYLNIPSKFELEQNYPNPFSYQTAITYTLNEAADANIKIYDILGQEIKRFSVGFQNQGVHGITWDGTDNFNVKAAPGIYFYQLQSGRETIVKKMIFNSADYNHGLYSFSVHSKTLKKEELQRLIKETLFKLEINNAPDTKPQIYSSIVTNILFHSDTVINFIASEINTSRTFNIHGTIAALSIPVQYAEVIFTNASDPSEVFSDLSDTLGNYNLTITSFSDEPLFNVLIKNMMVTDPQINDTVISGITVQSDTAINFNISQMETGQRINIIGNVAAGSVPVQNAEVSFINLSDTTKKYLTITDTSGNYEVSVVLNTEESFFKSEVKNTNSTQSEIYNQIFDSIVVHNDTTINFKIESVGPWRKVKRGISSGLMDIDFPDSLNGWVVGSNLILHTSDGGESWLEQLSPVGEFWSAVDFLDNKTGWICSFNAGILKTTDGGKNWKLKYHHISEGSLLFYDIQFLDSLIGFAVGGSGSFAPGLLLKTTDGGESWKDITPWDLASLKHISIVNKQNIWICGFGNILFSSDLGETWIKNNQGLSSYWFNTIEFINENNGWVGCDDNESWPNQFYTTTNGGKTWTHGPQDIYFGFGIRAMSLSDSLNGVIALILGFGELAIITTYDGGDTWNMLPSDTNLGKVMSISLYNKNLGWAVGTEPSKNNPGVILRYKK